MTDGEAAALAAARACLGTPFRPQGRLPGVGLDCVGLVLVAAAAAGIDLRPPPYRLSGDPRLLMAAVLAGQGWRPAPLGPGRLIVMAPGGPARHLGLLTDAGVIHAHAGLGRVVEGPLDPAIAVIGCWALPPRISPL